MSFIPTAYTHDTTREQLIARFRDRIATNDRTKLSKDERGELILHFIDRLGNCKTENAAKALCAAEIALLEEGYPVASIANQYLPDYRKAIARAIDEGRLPRLELPPSLYGKVYPHWGLYHLTYPNEVQQQLSKKRRLRTI
ncbi:hypothetical protein JOY44_24570 (plasmid) [Phormidium sp. CLA17]|uniref:hypothetical protein n=1 Tax=Leptolyngbya sp. Cla-17 TaxID=2803751 RepID=UPI0014913F44|nr:hypothetical protein [Leptolyngbya sp. Cla-17]MBM0744735.1 hypothetical protein [Leptolyngbya sp. Cla-17]